MRQNPRTTGGPLGCVLPASVTVADAHGDRPDAAHALYPAERAHVARAVDRRRAEFATVRVLAREALTRLGVPPVPLVPDRRGAPPWPPGVVGSMTHCAGYRAAAVDLADASAAIGIDAEPDLPLPDGVLATVTLPAERIRLPALAARRPGVAWDRLHFSAKESVFKAWYPLMRRELDFTEARIVVDPDAGTFTATLLVPGPTVGGRRRQVLHGRWHAADGLLVTAVHVPAPAAVPGASAPRSESGPRPARAG